DLFFIAKLAKEDAKLAKKNESVMLLPWRTWRLSLASLAIKSNSPQIHQRWHPLVGLFGEVIGDSGNSVLHERLAEVEQVSEPLVSEAQVGQELLPVHLMDLFDTLQLDDDLVFDDEVHAKGLVESEPLIRQRNRDLPFHL